MELMDELKTFRKIVNWMLTTDKDTNEVMKLADMTLDQYAIVMADSTIKMHNFNSGLQARIQAFNKQYFEKYLHAQQVAKMEYVSIVDIPVKEKKEIPVTKDSVIQSTAVNQSKSKALSDERKAQRAQEKLFHEKLIQLNDFCPDHMTFDIILKRKYSWRNLS